MTSPLSGSLARAIHLGLKGTFLTAALTRDVAGTPSPDTTGFDPAVPTQTTYTCKAIHEAYSEMLKRDGLVKEGERKVIILAESLSVEPTATDRITIRSETFTILDVEADPALATWTCRASK
jgi:hypothetical protein